MISEALRPLVRPIGEFTLLDGNPRRGDVASVKRSLQRFGQRKPIVVREDGTVELGWSEIAVVAFGDDDATAKAFALADNRTSELGAFDMDALAAMAAEVHLADPELLEAASYTEADLNALLAGRKVPDKRTDPDAVPDAPADPVTRMGDVWLLGGHRLLCGDATDIAAVEAMLAGDRADCMWTDPPYGVDYVGKTKDALTIRNDAAEGLPGLLAGAYAVATAALKPGAAVYVAHPPGPAGWVFWQAFAAAGWSHRQNLVWDKGSMVLGHSDYHYRHESILFGYTAGEGRRGRGGVGWYGDNTQTSVFEIPKPSRSEAHPTMKPVELIARQLVNSCPPAGLVYEPFAGSGSTIIAAYGLNMRAAAVELDPVYCDVICRRYQEHTGTKPVLLSGDAHDFTAD